MDMTEHRYHEISGDRQRALQYLKALRVGLIQTCRASTNDSLHVTANMCLASRGDLVWGRDCTLWVT